jgi:hypothetical protein
MAYEAVQTESGVWVVTQTIVVGSQAAQIQVVRLDAGTETAGREVNDTDGLPVKVQETPFGTGPGPGITVDVTSAGTLVAATAARKWLRLVNQNREYGFHLKRQAVLTGFTQGDGDYVGPLGTWEFPYAGPVAMKAESGAPTLKVSVAEF